MILWALAKLEEECVSYYDACILFLVQKKKNALADGPFRLPLFMRSEFSSILYQYSMKLVLVISRAQSSILSAGFQCIILAIYRALRIFSSGSFITWTKRASELKTKIVDPVNKAIEARHVCYCYTDQTGKSGRWINLVRLIFFFEPIAQEFFFL